MRPPPYAPVVDYLPMTALGLTGRLGLTRVPGIWFPGRPLGSAVRLREDLESFARIHGARTLVTLLEPWEIGEIGNIEGEARRAGLAWIHFPIPDMSVPSSMKSARRLVDRILFALEAGENVVVHCWAGLGRSGLVAASCLVARGASPERAVEVVRAARVGAIQNADQERFVAEFAAKVAVGR